MKRCSNSDSERPEEADKFDADIPSSPPSAMSGTKKKKKKAGGISFGEVRVREHERVLDKCTSKRYGLAIGWGHQASTHHVVDDFEQKKVDENHSGVLKKKVKDYERLQKVSGYGYKTKEVMKGEKIRIENKQRRDKGLAPIVEPDPPAAPKNAVGSPVKLVKGLFGRKKKVEA